MNSRGLSRAAITSVILVLAVVCNRERAGESAARGRAEEDIARERVGEDAGDKWVRSHGCDSWGIVGSAAMPIYG